MASLSSLLHFCSGIKLLGVLLLFRHISKPAMIVNQKNFLACLLMHCLLESPDLSKSHVHYLTQAYGIALQEGVPPLHGSVRNSRS
jgi:hypothetical protein